MIFGINCVLFSIKSDPGAGISGRCIASAAPSSKSRAMSVLKALTRDPMIMRFITRKMMVPRRIVKDRKDRKRKVERGGYRMLRECPQVNRFRGPFMTASREKVGG